VSIYQEFEQPLRSAYQARYLDNLALLERLHRLMLDVIKDEFERLGVVSINPVQALLLFNIGQNEVTAGELKSRGYYQGSNVSYNLKKLVEQLTPKGQAIRLQIGDLFDQRQNDGIVPWIKVAWAAPDRTLLGRSDTVYLLECAVFKSRAPRSP
jgi:hypothetical protein